VLKTFKKFFILTIISGLGYLGIKLFQLFKGIIELDKTLPQYLGNLIDEVPIISIVVIFNKITIKVKCNKDVIKNNDGLENIIKDYVTDFYPIFKANNVKVLIEELEEENTEIISEETK